MSIIKQQIQNRGQDTSILINLGQNINFTGYQQGIDNFTGEASAAVINPENDLERYRFILSSPATLDFYFKPIGLNPSNVTLTIGESTTITFGLFTCVNTITTKQLTFTLNYPYSVDTRIYYTVYAKTIDNGVTTQDETITLSVLFTAGTTIISFNATEYNSTICTSPPSNLQSWQNNWTLIEPPVDQSYQLSFYPAGFSYNDLIYNTEKLQNSFFSANFYDSFDSLTQIKYFTGYLTLLVDPLSVNKIPEYVISSTDNGRQFNYFYIPNNYINSQTGTTVTGYTQFTFYNANIGLMQLFFNQKISGLTTNEKMFFKTVIDLTNKTFRFTDTSPLKAYQMADDSAYAIKYNQSLNSMSNNQEVYPSGNSFNYLTGKYDISF
jgi:hypothetical protein